MPRAPASISSSGSSIAGALAGLTGNKGKISIHIDNHYAAKAYTSKSTVAGHVTIHPGPKDLSFDHLQITLHGFTETRVGGTRGIHTAKHNFLELHMPIAEESYPVPRVYEADQSYTVPFTFVIPENLVLSTCKHACQNADVQEHHRALPPSMGRWLRDDMAPEMAYVEYALRAKVYVETDEYEVDQVKKKTVTLLEKTQLINVLPAFPEQPPLSITQRDKQYVMTKTKPLKKSMFSKLGKLTVMAAQPAAVMLSADGRAAPTTQVTLDLRFDPSSAQSEPPKILKVGGKVTAHTYFSLGGIGDMPNLGDWVKTYGLDGRGAYETSVGLPDFPVQQVEWTSNPNPRSRRDSGYESEEHAASGLDTADVSKQRTPTTPTPPLSHSTRLRVPVRLPVQSKTFVPTFHSCRTSRVYILTLDINVSSGGSNTLAVKVKVPLQIGVEPARQPALGDPEPPSFEAAVEEAAIEGPSMPNRGELPGYSESR